MSVSPEKVYGPLVLGALFASFLSGLTTLQSLLYLRLFSKDPKSLKTVVISVWVLDLLHTAIMWDGMWFYIVDNFGDESKIEVINYCIPVTGIITAAVTAITHGFYSQRIFHLSGKKYWLVIPILILAFIRMCASIVASGLMFKVKNFPSLLSRYTWVITVPFCLLCATDVLITLSMSTLLRMNRNKSLTLNHVIDLLVRYTYEMGILTGLAAVAAMLCWIVVPNKLVCLGLYFPVGKLYANALLGSLNARYHLRKLKKEKAVHPFGSGMHFAAPPMGSSDSGYSTTNVSTLEKAGPLKPGAQLLGDNMQHAVQHESQLNSNPESGA